MKLFHNNEELLADQDAENRQRAPAPPREPERPLVYPGNMPTGPSVEEAPPLLRTNRNRPAASRKISPFNIILILLGAAVAIVLYIGNVIAVNELMNEVSALEARHQQVLMEQEILRAQINRLASLERIQPRAETELGLKSLREPPVWIKVDPERIKKIEEASSRP